VTAKCSACKCFHAATLLPIIVNHFGILKSDYIGVLSNVIVFMLHCVSWTYSPFALNISDGCLTTAVMLADIAGIVMM